MIVRDIVGKVVVQLNSMNKYFFFNELAYYILFCVKKYIIFI